VRHPDRRTFGTPSNRRDSATRFNRCVSVLAFFCGTHFPAQGVHHELQSIANAEHRHAQLQHFFVCVRRAFVITDDGPPDSTIPTGE